MGSQPIINDISLFESLGIVLCQYLYNTNCCCYLLSGTVVLEPTITIYLYGSYINCRAEKNKVINIVKFKTQSKLDAYDDPIDSDFQFAVVVKSDEQWVPFVSITNKWKAPEDPRELNKTLFQSPPEDKPHKPEVSSNPSHKK